MAPKQAAPRKNAAATQEAPAPVQLSDIDTTKVTLGELKTTQYKTTQRNLLYKGRSPFLVKFPHATRLELRTFGNDTVAYFQFEDRDFDAVEGLTNAIDTKIKSEVEEDPTSIFGPAAAGLDFSEFPELPEFKGVVVDRAGYAKQFRATVPIRHLPKLRKSEFGDCVFFSHKGQELSFGDVTAQAEKRALSGTPTVELSRAWASAGGETANANPTADKKVWPAGYGYKAALRAFVLSKESSGEADGSADPPPPKKLKFEDARG